jgi:cyanophycin synthetase
VAIKPLDCDLGFGVTLDVRTRERAAEAYRLASDNSSYVLVEKFAPGIEHRVLVTGDTIAAVSRIEPPHVVGDDRSTIRQLVDRINADPRRGEHGPLYPIKLDESAAAALALQGHSFQTVPREGERVLTRRNPPYIKHGGSITDWTDRIHPTVVGHALAAARALKLPVAGLDVVATDISQPLEEQGGVVVEVNAGPGLWLHMEPWADSPLPVGQSIVRTLFPEGESGRIPILAVLGSTAALGPLLAERLNRHSIRLGQLENGTIHAGKRRWPAPGATPQERAQALLQNTQIDAALIQTTGPELVEAGFACDRCDVVLVLESHSNADLFEESLRALLHALVPSGRLIVKAGVLVQQLQLLYQERITFFSPSTTESEIADLVVGLVCPNP